jgi:hypothetical protein
MTRGRTRKRGSWMAAWCPTSACSQPWRSWRKAPKAVPRQGLHSEVGVKSLLQHAARTPIELVLQFALTM